MRLPPSEAERRHGAAVWYSSGSPLEPGHVAPASGPRASLAPGSGASLGCPQALRHDPERAPRVPPALRGCNCTMAHCMLCEGRRSLRGAMFSKLGRRRAAGEQRHRAAGSGCHSGRSWRQSLNPLSPPPSPSLPPLLHSFFPSQDLRGGFRLKGSVMAARQGGTSWGTEVPVFCDRLTLMARRKLAVSALWPCWRAHQPLSSQLSPRHCEAC